ncbi:hypothetical protein R1sor_002863 [Riccia sorocarpa]|uniref:Uncharacterized protein n=1 Tax=Riccia sorocarpa TaxID=122646 RepID=A0ABD3H238_9MARC
MKWTYFGYAESTDVFVDIESDEPSRKDGKKLPKPCAVKEHVSGMRIRGCTSVNESTSRGVDKSKRQKLSHEPDVRHEAVHADSVPESAE